MLNEVGSIIRELRPTLLKYWGTIEIHHMKEGTATDVVTQLDLDIETITKDKLAVLDSSIEFVGEECGGNRDAERYWLMDPIDGTSHFVRGLPFSTTMLALMENGEAILSIIYDFVQDHLYTAEKGRGAHLNGEAIHVSNRPLAASYYGYETNLKKPENAAKFNMLLGRGGRVQFLCAGWEFAMVANGKLDARICLDPFGKDYDFAPGCLLVAEAGGVVRNIGADSFNYKNFNFIAGNPFIYRDLTEGENAVFPVRS